MDLGLFVARVVFGLLMAAHGAQKLFGWFGGYGFAAVAGFFESLGFRPGRFFAAIASFSELAGGLLIAAGLLGPVGPALVVAVMIVAAGRVHWQNGLFAGTNGVEVPLLYATGGVALALTGPGRFSLDGLFSIGGLWTPALIWAALIVGAIGGLGHLAIRRAPEQVAAAAA